MKVAIDLSDHGSRCHGSRRLRRSRNIIARFSLCAIAVTVLAGCNPFASLTVDEGFTVDSGNAASMELLVPDRRLPQSAKNIAGRVKHFQDTFLWARFDAPLGDARRFQADVLKGKGAPCSRELWYAAKVPGWPATFPAGGECRDDSVHDDEYPPISVTIVPDGARATVYVATHSN